MTRTTTKKDTEAIREMIDQRLKVRAQAEPPSISDSGHLDEDSICAFVEARSSDAESAPVISHLVACGLCRQSTAQLVRMEFQIEITDEKSSEERSSRLTLLLKDLASRMIPESEEDAVFAYQSPPSESDQRNKRGPELTSITDEPNESAAESNDRNKKAESDSN